MSWVYAFFGILVVVFLTYVFVYSVSHAWHRAKLEVSREFFQLVNVNEAGEKNG